MKQYIGILLIFALLMVAIPAISLLKRPDSLSDESSSGSSFESQISSLAETPSSDEEYLVLDTKSGDVLKLSARDYLIGAVCAEMPASFHKEALKAQAVAAHTYAARQKQRELASPTAELKGAYFSNDFTKYQAFFTKEQAKEFYGENFEENYSKISEAVDEVLNEILVYNDEPIIAAFHSMSGGTTESAEVVWGTKVDYLVPVDSTEDISSPDFLKQSEFTSAELSARLKTKYPDINLPEDKSQWITITQRSSSGTIIKLNAGGIEISGMDFRTLLSLRSANFEVNYSPDTDKFTITTKGYGHGVGLSQYGANAMANEGKTYKEILEHYYKGAQIKVLK
ncbi:MAG: stage sporulation protein [Clostridiales bacterium]|jgi:stage II sporulation protein D|nr:stage sporulation protein [Oscillospiraceae bacterium]MDN5378216.1 stage sporulation protein [Clostridiales bacterium]